MQEPGSVGSRDEFFQVALGLLGKCDFYNTTLSLSQTHHSETKPWPVEQANDSQDKAGA